MNNIKKPMNQAIAKYIVIALMLLDHATETFLASTHPLYVPFRFISRLTAPTMAYFIAEGYHYTKNVKKYLFRLGIFAAISCVAYTLFKVGSPIPVHIFDGNITPPGGRGWIYLASADKTIAFYSMGVIFTLFLGLLNILIWDKGKMHVSVKIILTLLILYISNFGDWLYYDVLMCLVFYFLRNDRKKMWLAYSAVMLLYVFGIMPSNSVTLELAPKFSFYRLGTFLVIPFIELLYNGKPGPKNSFNKWFFYIFYPAHLLILYVISRV